MYEACGIEKQRKKQDRQQLQLQLQQQQQQQTNSNKQTTKTTRITPYIELHKNIENVTTACRPRLPTSAPA